MLALKRTKVRLPSMRGKMKKFLMMAVKKTPLYAILKKWRGEREVSNWEREGRPVPPPHIVKQRVLVSYGRKFELRTLVETGTYEGDMIEATKNVFEHIYSIELSKELFEGAKQRFKTDEHIELIHGDSGLELKKLVRRLDEPALFWLDGHYSAGVTARGEKDTPIIEELDTILGVQDIEHVVVIDDARCFGVDPAYPSVEELTAFIRSKKPSADIVVQDDSIRIFSRKRPSL